MGQALQVSAAGFYAWWGRPESVHDLRDRQLGHAIAVAHRESRGTYGAPRIQATLKACDVTVSRRRITRLMRIQSLKAKVRRRFKATTDSQHALPVADNLLDRQFAVAQPNVAWAGDIRVPQQAAWEMRVWPLAIGLQEQVANHRKRLGSKAWVVSVAEKAPLRRQVGTKEGEHP